MYLIYNREFELVGEVPNFQQVKEVIGEDMREQDVNTLNFTRGKTVLTEDSLKQLLHKIVDIEKRNVVDYITSEIEGQEDETVELKTSNRHLKNQVHETKEYLGEIARKIGRVVEDTKGLVGIPVNANIEEPDLEEAYQEEYGDGTDDELDTETRSILNHIDRKSQSGDKVVAKKKSASRIIPNRKKKVQADINFLSIIEGGKVTQIKDLKGNNLIKTTKLAEDVGLDREHVEYLMDITLRECGGTPKFQNKSVVSRSEAVWIIVSALTKRDGFGNTQRFQKTKENAEDFYQSWDAQKEEIAELLS